MTPRQKSAKILRNKMYLYRHKIDNKDIGSIRIDITNQRAAKCLLLMAYMEKKYVHEIAERLLVEKLSETLQYKEYLERPDWDIGLTTSIIAGKVSDRTHVEVKQNKKGGRDDL